MLDGTDLLLSITPTIDQFFSFCFAFCALKLYLVRHGI